MKQTCRKLGIKKWPYIARGNLSYPVDADELGQTKRSRMDKSVHTEARLQINDGEGGAISTAGISRGKPLMVDATQQVGGLYIESLDATETIVEGAHDDDDDGFIVKRNRCPLSPTLAPVRATLKHAALHFIRQVLAPCSPRLSNSLSLSKSSPLDSLYPLYPLDPLYSSCPCPMIPSTIFI